MMKDAIRLGTAMMKDAIRLGTKVMKAVIASRRPGRPGRPGRPAVSGHAGAAPQARGHWGVGVCVSGHVGPPSPPPSLGAPISSQRGSCEAGESEGWPQPALW